MEQFHPTTTLEMELILERLSEFRAELGARIDAADKNKARQRLRDHLGRCSAAFAVAEALLLGGSPTFWSTVSPLHKEAVISALTSIQVEMEMMAQDAVCPLTGQLHHRCAREAEQMIQTLGGRVLSSFGPDGAYHEEVS